MTWVGKISAYNQIIQTITIDIAVYADPNGNSSGKSYVVFGKANNSAINLSDIANANNPTGGFVINGEVAGDRSGHAVSSAGDINGAPLPVRVSLPAPATNISSLWVPVSVLAFLSPK
jgi:hypothetical protein